MNAALVALTACSAPAVVTPARPPAPVQATRVQDVPVAPARPDAPPTADVILERGLEARGGRPRFLRIRSLKTRTVFTFSGETFEFEQVSAPPDHMRSRFVGRGVVMETGFDGTTAWQRTGTDPGKAQPAQDTIEVRRQSQFLPDLAWRELYPKRRLVGTTTYAERPAYEVVLETEGGFATTEYFDVETGWVLGTLDARSKQGLRYVSWVDVEGVAFPAQVEVVNGEGSAVLSYAANVPLPSFAMP
jgi:hypothetical protein